MKFLLSLREYLSVVGLQKLQTNSLTVPTAEQLLPSYLAVLTGFIFSTVVGFSVAFTMMPKIIPSATGAKAGAPEEAPTVSILLPDKPRDSDFTAIVKRNIFDSTGSSDENAPKATCELVKSQLPLRFTGVIFGGTSETSLVLLESTATKQTDTFLLGDLVPGDAKVTAIERSRVIFDRNNCQEYIDLEEPPPLRKRMAGMKPVKAAKKSSSASGESAYREDGFERDGTTVKATKQWLDKALTVDFAKTLQDMKASPNMVNGEVRGFVLTRIRPDSVYEKMGLLDGDVVEAINGVELNDAARAIQTLNSMRNEQNIELQVKRGGQVQNMKVTVR